MVLLRLSFVWDLRRKFTQDQNSFGTYLRGRTAPRKLQEAQRLIDVIPAALALAVAVVVVVVPEVRAPPHCVGAGVGISDPHSGQGRRRQGQVWRVVLARKPVGLVEHDLCAATKVWGLGHGEGEGDGEIASCLM